MQEHTPRLFVYAQSIAELFVPIQPDKLAADKLDALRKTWSLVESYAKDGFDERVLDAIMEKKADMILNATSIRDIRELSQPPKPHFDGRSWYIGKNAVPEEEMVWWSKASLRAPLNHAATMRYLELIQNFYGRSMREFMESSSQQGGAAEAPCRPNEKAGAKGRRPSKELDGQIMIF